MLQSIDCVAIFAIMQPEQLAGGQAIKGTTLHPTRQLSESLTAVCGSREHSPIPEAEDVVENAFKDSKNY
jgi:hypothetical protein